MNPELLKYLNSIIDRPIKLGETDCNSITAHILDILHNSNVHEQLTSHINPKTIRSKRASDVLKELGYKQTNTPKTGDFIIVPERWYDSVMFMWKPMWVISSFPRSVDNKYRKVRTMRLDNMPEDAEVYTYA